MRTFAEIRKAAMLKAIERQKALDTEARKMFPSDLPIPRKLLGVKRSKKEVVRVISPLLEHSRLTNIPRSKTS